MENQPRDLIELHRYPVEAAPDTPGRCAVIAQARRGLAEKGAAILPGFVRPAALAAMAREIE